MACHAYALGVESKRVHLVDYAREVASSSTGRKEEIRRKIKAMEKQLKDDFSSSDDGSSSSESEAPAKDKET